MTDKRLTTRILRAATHVLLGVRKFNNDNLIKFAKSIHNKKILELGSGEVVKNYPYSAKRFFDKSNNFIQSDIMKEYEYLIVDATKMNYKKEFDVIICTSVLEHVFEFEKVIKNSYNALKTEGIFLLSVPCFYPLHGEPYDYWRFTEHALRKLLKDFSKIKITHKGIRQYPFAYFVIAQR